MGKRIFACLLIAVLCLSLVACPAATPNPPDAGTTATTTTGSGTSGNQPSNPQPEPVLTLSAGVEYATVGKMLVFTAAGNGEGEYTFSLSDEDMVSSKTQDGNALSVRLAEEGELTVTVAQGETQANCKVTVFPRNNNDISVTDENIYYHGRMENPTEGGVEFRSIAVGFEVRFWGTALKMKMSGAGCNYSVFLDGETDPEAKVINASSDAQSGVITLAEFDEPGVHRVKVLKRSQEDLGINTLRGLTVEGGGLLAPETDYTLKIEVYGDSITCGHGCMRAPGAADGCTIPYDNGLGTYAYLAAAELGAEYRAFAKSGLGLYTNPYGDTKWLKDIYGNVSRNNDTPYAAENYIPDIVIINIGTNDCWAGNGSAGNVPYNAEDYKAAYIQLVKDIAARYEGHEIRFFLCSGMMENVLAAPVAAVAEALTAEGYDVHTVLLNRSSGGHPIHAEHKTGADILVNAIDEANQ